VSPRDPHFATGPREPKRDRWGRYLLPHPETGVEQPWTRVTTVANLLSDKYNLELWAQRMVALGLAKRADLLALVKTSRGDKRRLNKIVKDALEAGNEKQRANLGTAIHEATAMMDAGQSWEMPAPFDADVEAYGAEMDRRELNPVLDDSGAPFIERIVVVPELGLAGTLDRLMGCREWKLPRIVDIKTGSTVHFSELEHSIQESVYANATHYWDEETGELRPMPAVDRKRAVIVHLPAGEARCELHELDIARGYVAARLAVEVKSWRSARDLSRKL